MVKGSLLDPSREDHLFIQLSQEDSFGESGTLNGKLHRCILEQHSAVHFSLPGISRYCRDPLVSPTNGGEGGECKTPAVEAVED